MGNIKDSSLSDNMQRIASFCVDHRTLEPGLYLSRQDGDIMTYDLRMRKPNHGSFLSTGCLHAIEHLAATYLRNSCYQEDIIYFGPMGCRTGCYLLTRDNISQEQIKELLLETMSFIASYQGAIPGTSPQECGNYLDMDLPAAQEEAEKYRQVLIARQGSNLAY